MTPPAAGYYAGIDTHTDTHTLALTDPLGRVLSTSTHDADPAGYDRLLAALPGPDSCLGVGVEGTSSYGTGITRRLEDAGYPVVEVLRPRRAVRRRDGKSDPIDAVEAARSVAGGDADASPKDQAGWGGALRALTVARDRLVESMTALSNGALALVTCAPEALRERWRRLATPARMRALASCRPRDGGTDAATMAALRAMARSWTAMREQADGLEARMRAILERHAGPLLAVTGIGTIGAARLIAAIGGNLERVRGEAALAKLCGACPVPASSGRTDRHRLNRGGHRQANRVLHQAAVVRLAHHGPTREYAARRAAEGKGRLEVIRCLKRYIVREVWRAFKAIMAGTPAPCSRGGELRALRRELGVSQQHLGEVLAVASSRISEIETGKRFLPGLERRCFDYLHAIGDTPTKPLDKL